MNRFKIGAFLGTALALALPAFLAAAPASNPPDKKPEGDTEKSEGGKFEPFKTESVTSNGTVTVGGQSIAYQAVAGTLIVHPKDWDDVPRDPKADRPGPAAGDDGADGKNPTAVASMFYVAYFKNGGGSRPVTFIYNGGPGSATVWLHMGAFGPSRCSVFAGQ
jgi:carboxypeptidase C (cathepsin A)